MEWTMFFLFVALKVPLIALCLLVWWAIRQEPEFVEPEGGGGAKRRAHPHKPLPRPPRRGPHGGAALPSPPRVRGVAARSRRLTQRTSSASTRER